MAGTWSYPKTWIDLENLTNEDLNAQFQAVLDNFQPSGMDDYSSDVAQMQLQTSPGDLGSESLPVSLAGEIERIRFQIAAIIGQPYWYQKPAASLSADKPPVILSLPFKGVTAAYSFSDSITRGLIANSQLGDTLDATPVVDFQNTNKKFGDFVPVLSSTPIFAVSGKVVPLNKESLSMWMRNYPSDHYLAFNIQKGIYLRLNALGRVESVLQLPAAQSETAKQTLSNLHSDDISLQSDWKNVIVQLKQNNVDGAGNDRFSSYVGNDDAQEAGSNISTNPGDGGVWFFGCDKVDPVWDKFSAMQVTPNSEAVDPWSFSGTAGQITVGSGVLNVTGSGTQTSFFSKTNSIDLSNQTVEAKLRFLGLPAVPNIGASPFSIALRDDSMDRSFFVGFFEGMMLCYESVASATRIKRIPVDTSQYHVYRFVFSGSPDPEVKIFIDGVLVGVMTLTETDATAADLIRFGDSYGASTQAFQANIEWFAYADQAQVPVEPISSAANIDDLFAVQDYWNDSARNALQAYAARIALGRDKERGLFDQLREGTFSPIGPDTYINSTAAFDTDAAPTSERRWFLSDGFRKIKIKLEADVSNDNAANLTYLYLSLVRSGFTDPFVTLSVADAASMGMPVGAKTGVRGRLALEQDILLPAGLYYAIPYIADPSTTNANLFLETVRIHVSYD